MGEKAEMRRYFILEDDSISYYKAQVKGEPEGILKLVEGKGKVIQNTEKKASFIISGCPDQTEDLIIESRDVRECDEWIKLINSIINPVKESKPEPESKQETQQDKLQVE